MDKTIKDFPKQFEYEPVLENAGALEKKQHIIAVGMGGSHLAADILKLAHPELPLVVHKDYGLPRMHEPFVQDSLVVLNSYSGNTEEVLDSFYKTEAQKLATAVIATGGELLKRAKEKGIPYIEMPDTGIQPRMALGFHIRALMKLLGMDEALAGTKKLSSSLDADMAEKEGKALAEKLSGKVPVIYSSATNHALAYNWKIKFNETGKIPAFYNVFPELNHNEMTGFDIKEQTKKMGEAFHFIFLKDEADHPQIQKRMEVCRKLYEDRGLPVKMQNVERGNIWGKIFSSLLIADWAAFYTAEQYGFEPESVPIVEEFKKMI